MSHGQGNEQAIADLIAALDGLATKINRACAENQNAVPTLLRMAFAATPYEALPRHVANDVAPSNAVNGAWGVSEPGRTKSVKGKKARNKSLPQPVFEYVVLALLSRRKGVVTQKADLIADLPPKLDFGNDAAITTRLNKMRNDEEAGYITWDKGKQQTAIVMTSEGEKRLTELMGSGSRALTPEKRKLLASKGAWFGEPL